MGPSPLTSRQGEISQYSKVESMNERKTLKIKKGVKEVEKAKWEFKDLREMKRKFAKFLRGRNEKVSYDGRFFTYKYVKHSKKDMQEEKFTTIKNLISKISEVLMSYEGILPIASVFKTTHSFETGEREIAWVTTSDRVLEFNFDQLTARFDSCGDPSFFFISELVEELGRPCSVKYTE